MTTTMHDDLKRLVVSEAAHRGLSQSELARRAGVQRSELGHWLRGQRNLRSDKVCRTLDVLQLKVTPRG